MKQSHIVFGTHACVAALENPMRKIKRVLSTRQTADELKLNNAQIVEGKKIESMLPPGSVHQGVAIECEPLPQPSLQEWLLQDQPVPVLLLDQVSDPHNVGAMLRSAAAFGVGAVIGTDRNAPQESGVMAKAASGALELVPLNAVTNLAQSIQLLKKSGYWIYGLDGEAKQTIRQTKFDAKTALVMGAEGKGLRRLTAEHCDMLVKIPMDARMESLNVSNAAAVAMYELKQMTG